MKRSFGGRGRGRGRPNFNARSRTPVNANHSMSDHLLDLDRELQLLRQKREMLERHQTVRGRSTQSYERQSYNTEQYDYREPAAPSRNFSQLYDQPQDSYTLTQKRRADSVWDTAPRKRSRGSKQVYASRPIPAPKSPPRTYNRPASRSVSKPEPLMDFTSIPKRPGKPSGIKFVPSNSKPVSNQMKPSQPSAKKRERYDENEVLTAEVVPSAQLTGRLELALGQVLKELKEGYELMEPYTRLFHGMATLRSTKQEIRDRIRIVMLGKVVGTAKEILEQYRAVFPVHTDKDLLDAVLEGREKAYQKAIIDIIESDDPEQFYKINMNRLISTRLSEMIAKLHEIYVKQAAMPAENDVQNVDDDVIMVEDGAEKNTQPAEGNSQPVVKPNLDSYIENQLNSKLPSFLRKHKQQIINLFEIDRMYTTTKAAIAMKAHLKAKPYLRDFSKDPTKNDDSEIKKDKPQAPKFFVKIFSRPTAKKHIMQEFLEQYHPKVIKKHRTVHSLLFVGFTEKEDFDNILKADGTALANGKYLLDIKVSERTRNKKNQGAVNESANTTQDVSEVKTESDAIPKIDTDDTVTKDDSENKETAIIIEDDANKPQEVANKENQQGDGETSEVQNTENKMTIDLDDDTKGNQDENDCEIINEENDEAVLINESTTDITNGDGDAKVEGGESGTNDSSGDVIVENQQTNDNSEVVNIVEEKETVQPLKSQAQPVGTPTRASARLANVPARTIATRRTSTLDPK